MSNAKKCDICGALYELFLMPGAHVEASCGTCANPSAKISVRISIDRGAWGDDSDHRRRHDEICRTCFKRMGLEALEQMKAELEKL